MRILATGPSGAAEDLDPLRAPDLATVLAEAATLIDTARGEVVDEEAVTHAIDEHWIAGAAGRRANLALALAQILAVGRGKVPAHVVNPDAIVSWRRMP